MKRQHHAFTLTEILLAVAIIGLLATAGIAALGWSKRRGDISVSTSNLHLLATANLAYASDHAGYFCPAHEPRNLRRWHGSRKKESDEFEPEGGFLTPYLGTDQRVKTCPLLKRALEGRSSFEDGAGGYGYNAIYIGGTPTDNYSPASLTDVPYPSRTVMFATTGFAKEEGVQEYPFAEPFYAPTPQGGIAWELQPSVHFRAAGRALVAWCDGHVSQEEPYLFKETNFYGGNNQKAGIGWFGPEEENGFWNPASPAARDGWKKP
jgi:prepilin-type N-terminal cleavage/methylation domain-containing protein/prepilin-type processing-associated H-X9-DG protein